MSPREAVVEQPTLPARLQSRVREVLPFDDGSSREMYLARLDSSESQFLLSARLAQLLELLDGSRTVEQVAKALSRNQETVTASEVEFIIATELLPRKLVQEFSDVDESLIAAPPARARAPLDFVFRFPLLSQERLAPVVDRLKVLFNRKAVFVGLIFSALAHVAFYFQPRAARPLAFTSGGLLIAYGLALLTVVFHEFGHASACRRFRGEHGEIGFCLYLIFPALYVNLSRAWRLPGRERAVIDVGGMYFQLLLVIPFAILHLLFHNPSVATVIYAIDAMTLISLNPFLKNDGYWLLVDLSGIANLQGRALGLIGDCIAWPFQGLRPRLFSLGMGLVQKVIVVTYAVVTGLALVTIIPLIVLHLPNRFHAVMVAASRIPVAAHSGVPALILELGKLVLLCLFIPLMIRVPWIAVERVWKHQETVTTNKHLRFTVLCTAMLYVATAVYIGLHELGHASVGLALGAEVPLLQIQPAGGRTIAIFPMDAPGWKTGAMEIGGTGLVFFVALLLLPYALKPRRVTGPRLLLLYLGALSGLGTFLSAGLVMPAVAQGEVRTGLAAMGLKPVGQLAVQFALSCAGLLMGAVFLRRLLRDNRGIREGEGTASRLALAIAVWAIPMLLMAMFLGLLLMVGGAARDALVVGVAAVVLAGFGLAVSSVGRWKKSNAEVVEVDRRSPLIAAGVAALVVLAQMVVFGIDQNHPRGFFIGKPRDITVAALNVAIVVEPDQHAQVRMSMRPFVSSHDFLWRKVREQDPADWSVYDTFVAKKLPALISIQKFQIKKHYNDPKQRFYVDGKMDEGARVVEADVVLSSPLSTAGSDRTLRLADFWKKQRIGYVDQIGVEFARGLTIKRVIASPPRSRAPVRSTKTEVSWINRLYQDSFESSEIVFSQVP